MFSSSSMKCIARMIVILSSLEPKCVANGSYDQTCFIYSPNVTFSLNATANYNEEQEELQLLTSSTSPDVNLLYCRSVSGL